MSEWSGFTDADIKRMRQVSENSSTNHGAGPKIVKPVTRGRNKAGATVGQKSQRKPILKAVSGSNAKQQCDMPAGAMLSRPSTSVTEKKEKMSSPPTTPNEQIPLHGKSSTPPPTELQQPPSNAALSPKEPELLEDAEIIKEKEKIKFEDIQRRQKEMEEKNKKKKSMLSKAIAERKKKAFAESTKLIRIQTELAKLDDMLNYDVSILRDKIDEACHEYNAAQKRFEKAEAEYIESKMNLHKATEMKEDLTEHLYKLIQLNEERKANKLEELMQKLDLEESEDVTEPEPPAEPSNAGDSNPDRPESLPVSDSIHTKAADKDSPTTNGSNGQMTVEENVQ